LPLRNPEEGQTGLWFAAMTTGVRERRFGVVELAAKAVQFGEMVERRAGGRRGSPAREDVAGARDFGHRVVPLAAQLLDLGMSHETVAAIRDDLRLGVAPAAERGGPLARPRDVERFVAGVEGDAVDDAHVLRGEVVAGDGDHHLVEELVALGDLAAANERTPFAQARERDELARAIPPADRYGVCEVHVGLVKAFLHGMADSREEQQEAVDDALLAARILERPRSAAEPAIGVGGLAPHQAKPEPARRARGSHEVTDTCVRLVRATERGFSLLVEPDQERGAGEQLQLGRVELPRFVGGRKLGVSAAPGVAGEQLPARGAVRC